MGPVARGHLSGDLGAEEAEPATLSPVSATILGGLVWHNGWLR